MTKKSKSQAGFTLIELLVVIAIISLLSSIVMASLNSARVKARDSKRLQIILQVRNALELYFNDKGRYPIITCAGTTAFNIEGAPNYWTYVEGVYNIPPVGYNVQLCDFAGGPMAGQPTWIQAMAPYIGTLKDPSPITVDGGGYDQLRFFYSTIDGREYKFILYFNSVEDPRNFPAYMRDPIYCGGVSGPCPLDPNNGMGVWTPGAMNWP